MIRDFKWNYDDWTKEKILSISDTAETGYLFSDDLSLNSKMHEHSDNYPLCPESIAIKPQNLNIWQQENYKEDDNKKLCWTFHDQKNYVVNYRYLKLALSLGNELGEINRLQRTLKEKLTTHFITNDTVKRIHDIDDIIYNYNHSINRGICIEPYKLNNFIEQKIIENDKNKTEKIKENEIIINIGDYGREIIGKNIHNYKMILKYSYENIPCVVWPHTYELIKAIKNNVTVDDNGKIKWLITIIKKVLVIL